MTPSDPSSKLIAPYQLGFAPLERERSLTIRDALAAVSRTVTIIQGGYRPFVKLKAVGVLLGQIFTLLRVGLVQGGKGLGQWLGRRTTQRSRTTATDRPGQAIASSDLAMPVGEQVLITADHGEFEFHFTPDGLDRLTEACHQNRLPQLPDQLRSTIRQATLYQVIPPTYRRTRSRAIAYAQSGMSFCTVYHDGKDGDAQRIVRTVLSIDGDLLQQISHHALSHPRCGEMIAVHHWLSGQLLHQLRLSISAYIDKIMVGGSLSVFLVNCGHSLPLLVTEPLLALPQLALGAIASMGWMVIWSFCRAAMLPRLNRWVVRWVWQQLITPQSRGRSLAGWLLGLQ
ncbi:MAG: hypothetical protein EA367_18075 [Leptolyngbya sp. DLM2.Bin15]|nr:MAG: hypothetical protein EA367_18075 [Leptolyngbya sp. DLM2.Bin15]